MNSLSSDIFASINPAYTSLIIRNFLEGYISIKDEGCYYFLTYTVLPILLTEELCRSLDNRKINNTLLNWINENKSLFVDYNEKYIQMEKCSQDSLLFGIQSGLFILNESGYIELGANNPIKKRISENKEIETVMKNSKKYGKWCARIKNEKDIFYNLGVRI